MPLNRGIWPQRVSPCRYYVPNLAHDAVTRGVRPLAADVTSDDTTEAAAARRGNHTGRLGRAISGGGQAAQPSNSGFTALVNDAKTRIQEINVDQLKALQASRTRPLTEDEAMAIAYSAGLANDLYKEFRK